jgi:hypothetical protein
MFNVQRGSFTPVANATQADNFVLSALTVGITAKVKMFTWGSRSLTSAGFRTRWGRVNNTPATPTALAIANSNPNAVALCSVNTYATQATLAADPAGLFAQDWNSLGGGGVVNLPFEGEWIVAGGALGTAFNQIACGNIAGNEASTTSYGISWIE